jgi:hypothetical protein
LGTFAVPSRNGLTGSGSLLVWQFTKGSLDLRFGIVELTDGPPYLRRRGAIVSGTRTTERAHRIFYGAKRLLEILSGWHIHSPSA